MGGIPAKNGVLTAKFKPIFKVTESDLKKLSKVTKIELEKNKLVQTTIKFLH